jgi:hypothetical protein
VIILFLQTIINKVFRQCFAISEDRINPTQEYWHWWLVLQNTVIFQTHSYIGCGFLQNGPGVLDLSGQVG